jgi:hypothetical protein
MTNPHQPKHVRSVPENKKGKRIYKKNSPRMFLLAESSFAMDGHQDKRKSLQDWHPSCNWVHITRNRSCHLLLVICMSFDEQSTPTKTSSLCARKEKRKNARKEKRKNNLQKRILRMLLLAESSFAIDAQHDKRRSLQD